jgi:glycosyltransferase involved in cell wall biosynthesis
LPRSFYREEWFHDLPPNLWFNCVSESQVRTFRDLPNLLGVVQNGISIDRFLFAGNKREYVLWLGRICEEKGPHLAIEAARLANLPLVVAGQLYPFSYHRGYFKREIQPHLSGSPGAKVQFVDSPSFEQKVQLLGQARAVLLTSNAEETSSLVGMEAMACGTPVIALRRGAFPEIVDDGVTGFLVGAPDEMAKAMRRVHSISSEACRRRVERQFSARRMAAEYNRLYRRVLQAAAGRSVA